MSATARGVRLKRTSDATLYKWRRQAPVDALPRPGTKSFEADPLAQARRRIKELEAERPAGDGDQP